MTPQVAPATQIYERPDGGDGAGVVVAAGDEIPTGVGLIQNNPNRVDAAANYETVDAADKAQNPTPAGPFAAPIGMPGSVDHGAEARAEIAARVAEGATAHDDSQKWLGEEPAAQSFDESPASPAPATPSSSETTTPAPAPEPAKAPGRMNVVELDEHYGSQFGYPKDGNKADKVAFAKKGS